MRKLVLRHEDKRGGCETSIVLLRDGEEVATGGQIMYLDTDSCITDVELPSSTELGQMKDEYPGEWLKFHAVQPKVYLIERADLEKVTMKGFPMKMRTKANLARLEAGETLRNMPNGERWMRLEKVRSLARVGFRRPPKMNAVEKSFKSKYDKRLSTDDRGAVLPGGRTRAIVLNEPMGGFVEGVEEDAKGGGWTEE